MTVMICLTCATDETRIVFFENTTEFVEQHEVKDGDG